MSSRARLVVDRVEADGRWVPELDHPGDHARGSGEPTPPDPAQEAYARGFAEGQRQMAEAAASEARALAQRLLEAIGHLETERVALIEGAQTQLVTAALAIARHLLRRELQHDPSVLGHLARVAIASLRGASRIRVVVHPLDLDLVGPRDGAPAGSGVEYVADERVGRGGCRVESSFGEVEAGLDAQLAEIGRVLVPDAVPAASA